MAANQAFGGLAELRPAVQAPNHITTTATMVTTAAASARMCMIMTALPARAPRRHAAARLCVHWANGDSERSMVLTSCGPRLSVGANRHYQMISRPWSNSSSYLSRISATAPRSACRIATVMVSAVGGMLPTPPNRRAEDHSTAPSLGPLGTGDPLTAVRKIGLACRIVGAEASSAICAGVRRSLICSPICGRI